MENDLLKAFREFQRNTEMKTDTKLFYTPEDLSGKTPSEVADMITAWREDDEQLMETAFPLLNAIEIWLRGLNIDKLDKHFGCGDEVVKAVESDRENPYKRWPLKNKAEALEHYQEQLRQSEIEIYRELEVLAA